MLKLISTKNPEKKKYEQENNRWNVDLQHKL